MATNVWKGGAAAVAQVNTVTPANVGIGDTFTITINGKSVTVTATAATVANVTALMETAFNASTEPEFAEITAADATTHITLTADTAGVPFVSTSTETDGDAADTQTFVTATTTASSGPNDANINSNWSLVDVPEAADDVVFENSTVSCLYNLDVTAVLTLTAKSTFTGHIGLPRNNAKGYVEYRATAMELGTAVTTIDIGEGDGAGSSRINLGVGAKTAALAITVHKTASRVVTGIPPLLLTTGAQTNDTTMTVNRGDVGIAFQAGETAVIDDLTMGYVSQVASDAKVTCGSGVTLTTVTKSGGAFISDANFTTLTQTAGTTAMRGATTLTTATLRSGTLYYNSSGTLGALHVAGGATFDCRQDASSRTVSAATIYQGGTIQDPAQTVTWTAGIDLYHCALADVTIDIGEHKTMSLTAI